MNTLGNKLIINVADYEARVALCENDVVTELFMERTNDIGLTGNIYKGRVVRILPGIQAAFVDIGLERTGFLYVDDVEAPDNNYDKVVADVLPDDESQEYMVSKLEMTGQRKKNVLIESILREGQEIMVQVAKDPIGSKGARLTGYISLPGRNLVLMPNLSHIGVSRRIDHENERERLKKMIEKMKLVNMGCIVRTVAEGKHYKHLKDDMDYLTKYWKEIKRMYAKAKAPSLIHGELDLVLRSVRDFLTDEVDVLLIDSLEDYKRVIKFIKQFMPKLKNKVCLYNRAEPIFDYYEIEMEINRSLGRKVWLKSGGYIVIDQTEALVAIDVNTGRFVGKRHLGETILKTNLEAVKEIAYQLRLRNYGGIIIIDFIDMERESHREKVYQALDEALKLDKAKTNILKVSEFGLVQMTRKRVRESLTRYLCEPCPYCEGKGLLKSKTTICFEIFRAIQKEAAETKALQIVVYAHPAIVDLFYEEKRDELEKLERKLSRQIIVKTDVTFHVEQFELFGK